jgi:hypothetical protein
MPHRRKLAIITTAALAGLLLINAQARACDNERYPCPVVAEPQEPARATPAQPRKKAERPANEKASSRTEREASRTSSHANETKSAADEENGNDWPRDAAENDPPKKRVAAPTPALVPWWRVDRSLNDEVDRNESPVSAAAAAWLILPNPEVNADPQTAPVTAEAPATDGVRMVDASEVNELDLAAPPVPEVPFWLYYLLAALGGAVAAAPTLRFFWPEIRKMCSEIRKMCSRISSSSVGRLRMPEAVAKMAAGKKRPEKATRDDEPLFAAEAYPRRQPQAAMPRGLFPVAGEVR